jgi:hypothetical protein
MKKKPMANNNSNNDGRYIGTFILDFQTTNFESDSKIARDVLYGYQKLCNLYDDRNTFALDDPVSSAGWSFAKLFLSGEFIEKIYEVNSNEIDRIRDKKFEDKFVSWLNMRLKSNKCGAQVKIAMEMK